MADIGDVLQIVDLGGPHQAFAPPAGGAAPDLGAVVATGNDAGGVALKNLGAPTDPDDAARLADIIPAAYRESLVGGSIYLVQDNDCEAASNLRLIETPSDDPTFSVATGWFRTVATVEGGDLSDIIQVGLVDAIFALTGKRPQVFAGGSQLPMCLVTVSQNGSSMAMAWLTRGLGQVVNLDGTNFTQQLVPGGFVEGYFTLLLNEVA